MADVRLEAHNLLSRTGFKEGLLLGDRSKLIRAVKEHLQPLLDPRVELYETENCDNPIRVTQGTKEFLDGSITVVVPFEKAVTDD